MLNIIRSLNYSARRDTVNWIAIISMLGLPVFIMYISGLINGDTLSKPTPSYYFASQELATVFVFLSFGIMIFACKLVAGDAGDKTLNYELMAGHSRNRVYAGRMTAGYIWGAILVFILMMIPVGVLDLLYGWGPETVKSEVLIRCLLTFFPILRLCAYNMMLASLVRSAGKGIALGYASFMAVAFVSSFLQEMLEIDITYPTAFTNAAFLLVSENSRFIVQDGRQIQVFDTTVTGDMVWKTIAVSLAMSAVYMIIAYINFKKTDRD